MLQVQVKSRGRITLPQELRDANHSEDGDLILITDTGDGVIIKQHKKSHSDEIPDGIAQELRKEGVTLKDIRKKSKKLRK